MSRPVVFTAVYGSDAYFECMALMLESLQYFGKYDGQVTILSDRLEADVLYYVNQSMRNRVKIIELESMDFSSRYSISDYVEDGDKPIVHIDSDILIAKSVTDLFGRMEGGEDVYICSEAEFWPHLQKSRVADLEDPPDAASWFGYELIVADKDLRDGVMPVANSGLYGFKNRHVAKQVAAEIVWPYRHPANAYHVKAYTDQPYFNYAIAKCRSVNADVLSKQCSFHFAVKEMPDQIRAFNHFLWAGCDKYNSMAVMLNELKSGVAGSGGANGRS